VFLTLGLTAYQFVYFAPLKPYALVSFLVFTRARDKRQKDSQTLSFL
jgi:hypothetical protein